MNNKRIEYLDIVKFISIFLVIFCHFPLLNSDSIIGNVLMLVCWFAVPCFFMTTGAIFLDRDFDFSKWFKRLIKTYIVLVIWKIIYLIFFIIYEDISIGNVSKIDILKYMFLFQDLSWVRAEHMWFMNSYISIWLVYPLILMCFKNNNEQYKRFFKLILVFLILVSFCINDFNIIINNIGKAVNKKNIANILSLEKINPFGCTSNAITFFILGGILHKYKLGEKYSKLKLSIISLIGIIIGLIGLIILRYSYTNTFTWDGTYLTNGYNNISTCILAISVFVFFQTIDLKGNKIINLISQNTLGIFYMHFIILTLVKKYFENIGVIYNFLKTIIVLLISLIICVIMKKIKIIKEIF